MTWPFGSLERGAYRVVLADPPWRFVTFNDVNQSKKPERHYRTMRFDAIAALPVESLVHPEGAALALWTTGPMLERTFELLKAWGFSFRTAGGWTKLSQGGRKLAFGTGYLLRGSLEFFLLATRGQIRKSGRPGDRSVRNVLDGEALLDDLERVMKGEPFRGGGSLALVSPRREHSRKPDGLHHAMQTLFRGPYAEIFATEHRPGWDVFGNQLGKFR